MTYVIHDEENQFLFDTWLILYSVLHAPFFSAHPAFYINLLWNSLLFNQKCKSEDYKQQTDGEPMITSAGCWRNSEIFIQAFFFNDQ